LEEFGFLAGIERVWDLEFEKYGFLDFWIFWILG